jgi:hypothetical protein
LMSPESATTIVILRNCSNSIGIWFVLPHVV